MKNINMSALIILPSILFLAIGCKANYTQSNPFINIKNTGKKDASFPDFSIQHHEVTVGEYQKCVDAGVCTEKKRPYLLGGHERDFISSSQYDIIYLGRIFVQYALEKEEYIEPLKEYARHVGNNMQRYGESEYPISWISVAEARQYCQWLGGDLPNLRQIQLVHKSFEKGGQFSEREFYRNMMLSQNKDAICNHFNLPFHDIRVLIEQYGTKLPENLKKDKVIRICQTGPSVTEAISDIPEHLFGSLSEWIIRNPDKKNYMATGGSWLNGFFSFESGFNVNNLNDNKKAIDIGFRCIRNR